MPDNSEFLANALIDNATSTEQVTNLTTKLSGYEAELELARKKISILTEDNLDSQLTLANKEEQITTLHSEIANLLHQIDNLTHKLHLAVASVKDFVKENALLSSRLNENLKTTHLVLTAAKRNLLENVQQKKSTHSPFLQHKEPTKKKPSPNQSEPSSDTNLKPK